nr:UPF0462 protein C4orf33 homolog [Salvelinus alpinus]
MKVGRENRTAFPGLWDYEVGREKNSLPWPLDYEVDEVVEAFFLDSTTVNYLEVEVCPHGQHLVLLLSGRGHAFMQQLPLSFTATITGNRWEGEALLPWCYFPPNVNKMNSYAIHGSGAGRTYESLYPVPQADLVEGQKPNL